MASDEAAPTDLSKEWLDRALAELEQAEKARSLRKNNPYVRDIIRVLWPFPNGLARRHVIDRVWLMRNPVGLNMPREFEKTVQSAFNQHNDVSDVFKRSGLGPDDGLFYPYGGKGSGKWAVYQQKAKAWLERKLLPEP